MHLFSCVWVRWCFVRLPPGGMGDIPDCSGGNISPRIASQFLERPSVLAAAVSAFPAWAVEPVEPTRSICRSIRMRHGRSSTPTAQLVSPLQCRFRRMFPTAFGSAPCNGGKEQNPTLK